MNISILCSVQSLQTSNTPSGMTPQTLAHAAHIPSYSIQYWEDQMEYFPALCLCALGLSSIIIPTTAVSSRRMVCCVCVVQAGNNKARDLLRKQMCLILQMFDFFYFNLKLINFVSSLMQHILSQFLDTDESPITLTHISGFHSGL